MDILVVADGHYYKDSHGDVYVESVYDYNFYKRYLTVFDRVYAVARIEHVKAAPEGKKKSSGEGVEFLELPAYTGPWEYARIYPKLKRLAREYSKKCPCAIFRLPAASANFMCKSFSKTRKPFAVEIVVDPWENFAPGSIDSILRPIIRYSWTDIVKTMCKKANGASYVTEHYLQENYPCAAMLGKKDAFTESYSSVELPDDEFAEPKVYSEKSSWQIVHVANSFADYGKGHIPLLDALKIVRDKGYDVRVEFIGDGPKMEEFIKYSKDLGIEDAVDFIGRLPSGAEVRAEVRDADMFVFPTKAEGLPRGLLEAMSVGLPCLSSPTCGIPEVLSDEFLFKYDDSWGFANGIIGFIEDPGKMSRASEENIKTSRKYAASILNERRKNFYSALRGCTEKSANADRRH